VPSPKIDKKKGNSKMIIVDSHCHVSPYWYEPVESLLFHMDVNDVEHAVLVQYMGQFNNEYQSECMRRFPGRFASVVLVDTCSHNAPDELERLAEKGARGIRLRPNTRSAGNDPLAIWRKADELELPVSCGGGSSDFAAEEFADLIRTFPNLPIIIEHLGSVNTPDGESASYDIHQRIFALSCFPNAYIKIHGLGEFCRRTNPVSEPFPFEVPIPNLLEMAYESFGSERMMWGSDYPPVSGREGYRNSLRFTMDQLKSKSASEKEMIFGGVAKKIFRF